MGATTDLSTTTDAALAIGRAANQAASRNVFADYQSRKADNTLRGQRAALDLLAAFLSHVGIEADGGALLSDPRAWQGITWGLLEGFREWLLRQGYAIGTVNVRLSTVKTYAKLATKAGAIEKHELAMIALVEGYPHREAGKVDEKREAAGIPIRNGDKKAQATRLSHEQAARLRECPDTPQGRRDRVIVHALLDLGLRVGELAGIEVDAIDQDAAEIRIHRPKVGISQTHSLIVNDLQRAVRNYLENDAPDSGPLLRSSRKDGALTKSGMSSGAISARVRALGEAIGIEGLSAHDLRHHWATMAARSGTPLDRLKQAGGWKSYAMPLRYIEDARIANEGVKLDAGPSARGDVVIHGTEV